MLVAIHQPNFFPWLSYFDKIRRAGVLVFLDDVLYPRSGSGMGTWCNRVRIAVQGRPHWIGSPLCRYSGQRMIREIRIDDGSGWRGRVLRTLAIHYRRAPHFKRTMQLIEPLVGEPTDCLAEFNINAVTRLTAAFGVDCRFVRQSELGVPGTGTERLVNIIRAVGGDAYLCGGGATAYQDDAMLAAGGIALIRQNFVAAPYGGIADFLPGLSIIDYLMWAGNGGLSGEDV